MGDLFSARRVCGVAFLTIGLAALSSASQAHGTDIKVKAGTLKLIAVAPNVIRVVLTPNGAMPPESLAVVGLTSALGQVEDKPGISCRLSTDQISAVYDYRTNALKFEDAAQHPLLSGIDNGMSLYPITLKGPGTETEAAYKSVARFTLPKDEGIFGLGQHQQGFMDYRGSNVHLEQMNREVAIPFLVSSRGYGLFWDNPAATDVSVDAPSPTVTIPSSSFVDPDGKPGALTGEYFEGKNFEHLVTTRSDPQIDFDWKGSPIAGLGKNNFSVRWIGSVVAEKAGNYRFTATGDDGYRLFIDGKKVFEDWSSRPATTSEATVHFDANTQHSIRFEYYQEGGDAVAKLAWSPPTAPHPPMTTWTSEAARGIDFYFIYGPQIDQVIHGYRDLTGHAPMPAKWALGFWQSKERYKTQQEWLDIAGEYRKRHEPIDNIVQDWFYWDPSPWGSHAMDPKRYPDPAKGIQQLHDEDHAHIMISVWGKFAEPKPDDPTGENYRELLKRGFLYPNLSGFYDAFNPEARDLYWQQMNRALFSKGFDAWWLDASEPELDMALFRKTRTAAGLGARVLNAWPLEHTLGVYRHQRTQTDKKRVFILTRSAYAGQQRNSAATWSGDITASWKVFADQIPAGLNFGLSGIPYWATDTGAFFVPGNTFPGGASNPAYRELFTRWFQFSTFCPIFRAHGTDTPRELWRFGPNEPILAKFDRLRYRLMPYIYSQAWDVTHNDGTMMRALVMDFPSDPIARELKDEFMFGPSFLVAPVLEPSVKSRKVYLPSGSEWVNFWNGQRFAGGQTIDANATINLMPLFVRAGSIVPMGPQIEYADQKAADPIELRIVTGADGSYTLYEDEGDSYAYEKGAFATIPLAWDNKAGVLTIGDRKGSFPGMLEKRTFRVIWVRPGHGTGSEVARVADETVSYDGHQVTVTAKPL